MLAVCIPAVTFSGMYTGELYSVPPIATYKFSFKLAPIL